MARPSGDQRPTDGCTLPRVTWTGFEPSARVTQSCSSPERSERKQIRSPAGEYCGEASRPEEAMTRVHFLSLRSSRQMLRSWSSTE
jgi:hypothetical protein